MNVSINTNICFFITGSGAISYHPVSGYNVASQWSGWQSCSSDWSDGLCTGRVS